MILRVILVLVATGLWQEVRDARSLERLGWRETQHALAGSYPADLRHAGISMVTTLLADVTTEGLVTSATVLTASGFPALDSASLAHAERFRFVPPVAAGRYRLEVPWAADSLRPDPEPERCPPNEALTAIAQSQAFRQRPTFRPIRQTVVPPEARGHTHVVRFQVGPSGQGSCVQALAGWTGDSLTMGGARLLVDMCESEECDLSENPATRQTVLGLRDSALTWPENEWTISVETQLGLVSRWVVNCPDSDSCWVIRRPRIH